MTEDAPTLYQVKQSKEESLLELRLPSGETGKQTIHLRICIASDCALIVYADLDELLLANHVIKQLSRAILQRRPSYLLEYIPSYKSLFLEFDLLEADLYEARAFVKSCLSEASFIHAVSDDLKALQGGAIDVACNKAHRIPVCYELLDLPSDLEKVSQETSLTCKEVIATHCTSQLQVFATGFLPGFAYLGEIDESIQIPRLSQPRARVPSGAVAIADKQTAIYPIESPGGWHILGYTPISLISENPEKASLLQVGDRIQFYEISAKEYLKMCAEQASKCE